jgi:uncharacterized protein YggT (Ycf19 family)
MAESKEVIHEQQSGTTPSGKQVTREKTQVVSSEVEKQTQVWTANRIVYYVFGFIQVLLGFRFVLKALGANPISPFVSLIYSMSEPFVRPFHGMFRPAVTQGIETQSVWELSTLIAFFVYAIVATGIVGLIRILTAQEDNEV